MSMYADPAGMADAYEMANDQLKILMTIAPFQKHIQQFVFRTTASYYLCWFTIKQHPLMRKFGQSCKDNFRHLKHLANIYSSFNNDSRPFDCSLFSFCPDVCYGKAIGHIVKQESPVASQQHLPDVKQSQFSLCHGIDDGTCEISNSYNNDIEMMKRNLINVTCKCNYGYRFHTQLGTCADLDECADNVHHCRGHHETCLNRKGTHECLCKHGYKMKSSVNSMTDPNPFQSGVCTRDLDSLVFRTKSISPDQLSSLTDSKNCGKSINSDILLFFVINLFQVHI